MLIHFLAESDEKIDSTVMKLKPGDNYVSLA